MDIYVLRAALVRYPNQRGVERRSWRPGYSTLPMQPESKRSAGTSMNDSKNETNFEMGQ
jgi:hypothetical protein